MADEAFCTQVDELAASLKARSKVVSHLEEWLAESCGDKPPKVAAMTTRQLAFLLILEDRYEDVVEYLQAIWDLTFNDIPARGGDAPRLVIGAIRALKPPADGADTWEIALEANDSDAVVVHHFAGWEVVKTSAASR